MRSVTVVIAGILLASSIIVGVTLLQREGVLPEISTTVTSTTSHSLGTGTSSLQSIGVTTSTISSTVRTTSSSSSSPQSASPSSNFVLQIHDPPHVPPGVTAVYVLYSDILLRSTNATWYDLKLSGSINLMSIVNFTQTIANLKLLGGKYDQLQMKLSSVTVTSNSKNYSAFISNDQIPIPIIGGLLVVSPPTVSGAVIDVSPAVIQHTSQNSTGGTVNSFVLVPSANAYLIPQNHLNPAANLVGDREDIRTQSWLVSAENQKSNQTSFQLSSIALSGSLFKITVKNTGNSPVLLQTAFLESNVTQNPSGEDDSGRYNVGGAVLFGILSNGSLAPLADGEVGEGPNNFGYNLSASSQITLTYSGAISANTTVTTETSTDEIAATTITGSTTTSQTATASDDNIIVPMVDGAFPAASSPFQSGTLYQVSPGTSYTVGVTSGSLTVTGSVIAA